MTSLAAVIPSTIITNRRSFCSFTRVDNLLPSIPPANEPIESIPAS